MAMRISTIFPFIIITLLCVGGVEVLYRGIQRYLLDPAIQGRQVTDVVAESSQKASTVTTSPVDSSIITSRNLFGPPPADDTAAVKDAEPATEELEVTTLEVVLMGTIGGGEQGRRAIILNKKDRKQELYQVGDTIEGALIKEIQRGKVILNIDDRDEMLDMSEASQYGQQSSQPVAADRVLSRRRVFASPSEAAAITEQNRLVQPRVVRPTRRIVRPRAIIADEEVAAEAESAVEELPPEEQDAQVQEQVDQELTDQQQAQEQENEEPVTEQQ